MPKPRVLLGDDHALMIEGLRSVLASDFEIVGVASNGRDLVAEAERLKPDAVLLDVSMPLLNATEAARRIRQAVPRSKLVFVTQIADRAYVEAALELGASSYVLKECVVQELVTAVLNALDGRFYVTPLLRKGIPESLFYSRQNPKELFGRTLTPRQREVLQLVAEGKPNKEIAVMLDVSVKTVEYHKTGLRDTLGLRTTAELTRYAIDHKVTG
jgi:DNA-binding NarL/FixJ family response regulator